MTPSFTRIKSALAAYDASHDLIELNRKLREHEEQNDRTARPSRSQTQTLVLWLEP